MGYFAGMHHNHVGRVLAKMEIIKLKTNEMVMDYGDIGTQFFIIMEGNVQILIPLPIEQKIDITKNLFQRQDFNRRLGGMLSDRDSSEI